jgi:Domain of Unknown Function with PDB structure (DUF3857)
LTTNRCWWRVNVCMLLALPFAALAAAGEGFPPVTDAERDLRVVATEPRAPVVVLFRKAEFHMLDDSRQEPSSRLAVRERRKILSEAGRGEGDVRIVHSGLVRLSNFRGRTVLPSGKVLPLPADARFVDTASRSQRQFVTSVAFPGVEVGAILDFSYEVHWDSIFLLDPWYFQDRIPVLLSEITYLVPKNVNAAAWRSDPMQVGIKSAASKTVTGSSYRAWGENLPSVPDEPAGPPFGDLAAQMLLIPTAYVTGDVYERLLEDWTTTCKIYDNWYTTARSRDGDASRRAREIAAVAGKDRRAQAEAIYRFVRDEILTDPVLGVGLEENSTLAEVLRSRQGDPAEKALLLQVMLDAIKFDPQLVWAADRSGGLVDLAVPTPSSFDTIFVALDWEGERLVLDPSDRALPFGRLQPGYAGTRALLFDRKKPERIQLPDTAFDQNARRVVAQLELDDAGRWHGRGTLVLSGHHAWLRTNWQPTPAEAVTAWEKWLEEHLGEFDASAVVVREEIETQRVEVTWQMSSREEATLDGEATLQASRPLGPVRQSELFPAGRRTTILLPFADRDELELQVSWPNGWAPAVLPPTAKFASAAGTLEVEASVDATARSLRFRRRFDMVRREANDRAQMSELYSLYTEAQKNDAQALVLVRQ